MDINRNKNILRIEFILPPLLRESSDTVYGIVKKHRRQPRVAANDNAGNNQGS